MFQINRDDKIQIKKFENKINFSINNVFIEDNIHSLNALKNSTQKVDLIYIDPPYNTNKKDFKYNDSRSTSEWISFMYERILLAHDILSDKGVILISIDDNHYAYIKLIMDQVFGLKNFVANFIWKKSHTVKNDKVGVSTQQEYILCFSKDKNNMFFNKEKTGDDYIKKAYRYHDHKGQYRVVPLHKDKNKHKYDIVSPNGTVWNKGWNYNPEGFQKLIQDDMVYWGKDGNNCPSKKVYLKPTMEKSFGSMLPDTVGYTGDGKKDLKNLGFNGNTFLYAKPVKLIEHLLNIFSHKNSIILDFFAGSGTTGEAVVNLNLKDNGQRVFILATNNEENIATEITVPRILKVFEQHSLNVNHICIYNENSFK